MNYERIERHVEEAHNAKRGLRGHFTATEYNENWRTLRLLLDVAKAAEEMASDYEAYEYQRDTKDYSQPVHDPDIFAAYEQAITALQEHCDECNQR